MQLPTLSKPQNKWRVEDIPVQASPIVSNRLEKWMVQMLVSLEFAWVALKNLRNPLRAFRIVRSMKNRYRSVFGEKMMTKVAKVDGRYLWRLASPRFPSSAARRSRENEINRVFPFRRSNGMRSLIFGITKKCPLTCEHCYEWKELNKKERLSVDDLIHIVREYQEYGATHLVFSGGEPLLRIKDIYAVLEQARPGTDFWIVTSGWRFTAEQARALKQRGLAGILISLDHFDADKHDQFRGYPGTFSMAVQAALVAKKAGLVTALSLCATRGFVSEINLREYMELGKRLGVSLVQILEPKAVGRYENKKVELSSAQLQLLEKCYLDYNRLEQFRDYPIVNYLGYHQRRLGCFGAGDYFFYIDSNGDAHACPMCTGKVCSTLKFSPEDTVRLLREMSHCHSFEPNELWPENPHQVS